MSKHLFAYLGLGAMLVTGHHAMTSKSRPEHFRGGGRMHATHLHIAPLHLSNGHHRR